MENITQPTKEQADQIEKDYPNCEWVSVTDNGKEMFFAFKPFNHSVYYASIDIYNATKSIGSRNMTMATGHLINGKDEYLRNDKVRIALDLFAQSMLDEVQVTFKKKPSFTA